MFKAESLILLSGRSFLKKAGAQFVVLWQSIMMDSKMYASELGSWNSAEMGPMRDVLGELRTEIEERNMVLSALLTVQKITGFLMERVRYRKQM